MIEMDVRIGEVCYRGRLRLCGRMQQSRWTGGTLTLGLDG